MRRTHWRITIQGMLIAIALIALNFAAGVATSKYYPRKQPHLQVITGYHLIPRNLLPPLDQIVPAPTGEESSEYLFLLDQRPIVLMPPKPKPEPTWPRIWAPVLSAGALTLAALSFLFRPQRWRRSG